MRRPGGGGAYAPCDRLALLIRALIRLWSAWTAWFTIGCEPSRNTRCSSTSVLRQTWGEGAESGANWCAVQGRAPSGLTLASAGRWHVSSHARWVPHRRFQSISLPEENRQVSKWGSLAAAEGSILRTCSSSSKLVSGLVASTTNGHTRSAIRV